MTTPIGTSVTYYSAHADGYDEAPLPGLFLAPSEAGADDNARLLVFGLDGRSFIVTPPTRATYQAIGGAHGGFWCLPG